MNVILKKGSKNMNLTIERGVGVLVLSKGLQKQSPAVIYAVKIKSILVGFEAY